MEKFIVCSSQGRNFLMWLEYKHACLVPISHPPYLSKSFN